MARPRTRTLTLIAGDHGRDLPLRHRWTAPYAPRPAACSSTPLCLAGKGSAAV